MLVGGRWVDKWDPVQAKDAKGGFVRQTSTFRNWVTPDGRPGPTGTGGFGAEAGRTTSTSPSYALGPAAR